MLIKWNYFKCQGVFYLFFFKFSKPRLTVRHFLVCVCKAQLPSCWCDLRVLLIFSSSKWFLSSQTLDLKGNDRKKHILEFSKVLLLIGAPWYQSKCCYVMVSLKIWASYSGQCWKAAHICKQAWVKKEKKNPQCARVCVADRIYDAVQTSYLQPVFCPSTGPLCPSNLHGAAAVVSPRIMCAHGGKWRKEEEEEDEEGGVWD